MATQYTAGITQGQVWTSNIANQIGAAWETYTPTISGGATNVTATLTYARYARIQKIVFVQVLATVTSAGAANGIINVTFPSGLTPITTSDTRAIGTFVVKDTGTAFYTGVAINDAAGIRGMAYNAANYMGASTPAMTLANTDIIGLEVCYEVA